MKDRHAAEQSGTGASSHENGLTVKHWNTDSRALGETDAILKTVLK